MPDERSSATMPTPPQRLHRLPSWLFNQLATQATRLINTLVKCPGGARRQMAILSGLEEFGPISQADLSRRLGIDRSDLVTMLNKLEDEGLAARATDLTDRRRNAITITDAGRKRISDLEVELDVAQDALLRPLTTEERAQLLTLLQRLVSYHRGCPPRSC